MTGQTTGFMVRCELPELHLQDGDVLTLSASSNQVAQHRSRDDLSPVDLEGLLADGAMEEHSVTGQTTHFVVQCDLPMQRLQAYAAVTLRASDNRVAQHWTRHDLTPTDLIELLAEGAVELSPTVRAARSTDVRRLKGNDIATARRRKGATSQVHPRAQPTALTSHTAVVLPWRARRDIGSH